MVVQFAPLGCEGPPRWYGRLVQQQPLPFFIVRDSSSFVPRSGIIGRAMVSVVTSAKCSHRLHFDCGYFNFLLRYLTLILSPDSLWHADYFLLFIAVGL